MVGTTNGDQSLPKLDFGAFLLGDGIPLHIFPVSIYLTMS